MLTTSDKNEILKMIKTAKDELRNELYTRDDEGFNDRNVIHTDVSDNTNAIMELAEIIGG